ncbi:TolB family protein [Microbacterium sp.]|uniref:TolB family protein n=1 Tax=Microbacterium sp. TaxID=51671 RepID=UPI003C723ADD
MRQLKLVPVVGLCLLISVTGCSGAGVTEPTDDHPAVLDLLRESRVLIQWQGEIQVSDPQPWEPEAVVRGDVPAGEQLHPQWSPDGRSIAFALDDADGTRDLWIVDVASGTARALVDCTDPCVWTDEPSFSPDGTEVAYIQGDAAENGDGIGTVRSVPVAGGEPLVLFTADPTEYPFSVAWDPAGQRLAVEVDRFASAGVHEERMTGSAIAILTREGSVSYLTDMADGFSYPAWSPDGISILMSAPGDLWTMPSSGGEPTRWTRLQDDGGRALQGSYSADGAVIVFVVEEPVGSTPTVAVMSAEGGEHVTLGPGTHPRLRP